MQLKQITVDGVLHWAINIGEHYMELRTLWRHPLLALPQLWAWLKASRNEGGSV